MRKRDIAQELGFILAMVVVILVAGNAKADEIDYSIGLYYESSFTAVGITWRGSL